MLACCRHARARRRRRLRARRRLPSRRVRPRDVIHAAAGLPRQTRESPHSYPTRNSHQTQRAGFGCNLFQLYTNMLKYMLDTYYYSHFLVGVGTSYIRSLDQNKMKDLLPALTAA